MLVMSIKNKSELPSITRIDYTRKFRLGTRLITEIGEVFTYVKIDFGSLGKCIVGSDKIYRYVVYRWLRTH